MSNVLVVYYSRTGNTRRVAEELAARGGWDLERVIDTRPRDGLIGYLRSGFDSLFRRTTTLAPPRHDPADYDLVVVGTPVWNASVSTPIRTWLEERRGLLPALAFFATEGGRGAPHAFRQMALLAGGTPIATLELTDEELRRGALEHQLAPLLATIEAVAHRQQPGAPPHAPNPRALH
jgi:flavodoxin